MNSSGGAPLVAPPSIPLDELLHRLLASAYNNLVKLADRYETRLESFGAGRACACVCLGERQRY